MYHAIYFTGIWITIGVLWRERLPANYFEGNGFKSRKILLLVLLVFMGLFTHAYKYRCQKNTHSNKCGNFYFRSVLRSTTLQPRFSFPINTAREVLKKDMRVAAPSGSGVKYLLAQSHGYWEQMLYERLVFYQTVNSQYIGNDVPNWVYYG